MSSFEKVWSNHKNRIIIIVALIILSKIIQLGMCAIITGESSFVSILSSLNKFDSNHYSEIIINGYQPVRTSFTGEASWAFFPFFPILIRAIYLATNIDIGLIAFVVNSLFLFGAIIYGIKYMEITDCDSFSQLVFAILMTLGCYSFYCSLIYTEACSLFFFAFCLYHLEKKNYILMGIGGLLLSLTKNIGIFFEFVILIRWIMDYFNEDNHKLSFGDYFAKSIKNADLVFGVSIIPAGFFGFILYLYYLTGDGLAFLHVQYGWGRENSFFVKVFLDGIKEIASYGAYLAMWAVLGVWITWIIMCKYKQYHEIVLCLLSIVLSMQSALDSIPRYMFGALVFVKAASVLVSESKWYNKWFALLFMIFFELVLINGWIMGEGVLT